MSSLFLFAFLSVARVPLCEWELMDGSRLPSPCRYTFKSGEFMVLRISSGPKEAK
jgi:hypothetical protein